MPTMLKNQGRRVRRALWTLALTTCARPQAGVQVDAADGGGTPSVPSSPVEPREPTLAATAAGCAAPERAKQLRDRLQAAFGTEYALHGKTPLLPDRWPSPTGVVMYTYESHALPSGTATYIVDTPARKMSVAPLGSAPQGTGLEPVKPLGRHIPRGDAGELRRRLAQAEEVLVDVIAGCRSAESACAAFDPYREWSAANPLIARHLADQLGAAFPCMP